MGVSAVSVAAFVLAAAISGFACGPGCRAPHALADATAPAERTASKRLSPFSGGTRLLKRRSAAATVRARADRADKVGMLPPGGWSGRPIPRLRSMLIRLDYADGSQRLVDVDSQMGFATGTPAGILGRSSRKRARAGHRRSGGAAPVGRGVFADVRSSSTRHRRANTALLL